MNFRSPIILIKRALANKFFEYLSKFVSEKTLFINYDFIEVYKIISDLTVDTKSKILLDANRIIEGHYCIFCYQIKCESTIPEWQKDYLLEENKGLLEGINLNYDKRVVWELNRLHFLPILGLAYNITFEKKYYNHFYNIISDWDKNNLIGSSVNYENAMECSIRLVNIGLATILFKNLIKSDPIFEANITNFLYKKALFIYTHLEENINGIKSNHFLSDLLGLLFFGVMFPKSRFGKKYLKFSINNFEKEIIKQTHSDGVNFEHSTNYHRFSLEIFLYAYFWVNILGYKFSDEYEKLLIKMLNYVRYYQRPNGFAPIIGDNDSGRILKIVDYFESQNNNHNYLVELYNFLVGEISRDDFMSNHFNELKLFINEKINFNNKVKELNHYHFDESKVIFFKEKGAYFSLLAWDVGSKGIGNHQHNDQLSFELGFDFDNIIIDPGSFLYTASEKIRNQFRSIFSHNSIIINGNELNYIDQKKIFKMKQTSTSKILSFEKKPDSVYATVEIKKNKFLFQKDYVLQRGIFFNFDEKFAVIEDKIFAKGLNNFELRFHFYVGYNLIILDNKNVICKKKMNEYLIHFDFDNLIIKKFKTYYSDDYYKFNNIWGLSISGEFNDRLLLKTSFIKKQK